MIYPDSIIYDLTKSQLIEQIRYKETLIKTLENRIAELESRPLERRAMWKKDAHGVLRCTSCGHPAPKTMGLFYDGTKRVRTTYCHNCGAKMNKGD